MEIRNVSESDLFRALEEVNKKYEDNIMFNRFEKVGERKYRVTLRVKSSKKAGHRISQSAYMEGRRVRLTSACWHVHGDFFDALLRINPKAVIVSAGRRIYVNENGEIVGNWEDWNIGSILYPLYYSEACDCNRQLDSNA